jgi:predicted nucleic acid-binding protein
MVLFDSTFALLVWLPGVPASVSQAKERVEHLINELHTQSNKIIIPTPVISELLIYAGKAGPQYLSEITKSAKFKVAPFDTRAAVEVASMLGAAVKAGKKKGSSGKGSWPKTKFDHQIVAIGKVEGADTVYTDDQDLGKLAAKLGLKVVTLSDLPLPPSRTPLFDNLPPENPPESESAKK